MKVKVVKFGGSSVANAERITNVIDNIILKDNEIKYAVFSTFGKVNKDDIKVTDMLEKIAAAYFFENKFLEDNFNKLKNKYINESIKLRIPTESVQTSFVELRKIIENKFDDYDKYYTAVVAQGERIFIQIPYLYLKAKKINVAVCYPEKIGFITNSNYKNAALLHDSYETVKENLFNMDADLFLIPGFYAIDSNGDYTTFKRGGSDYTGALISNIVDADIYENFTDVDGILRVDPNVFDASERTLIEKIDIISYRELRELAYGGAKVIHSGTLKPLSEKKIPLRIRNTFDLSATGTLVVSKKEKSYEVVKGIAMRDNIFFLNIDMYNMDEEIGVGHFIEEAMYHKNISFSQVTSSIDSLSYAIPMIESDEETAQEEFKNRIESVVKFLRNNDKFEFDRVSLLYPNCLIHIVGEGMQNTVGLAGKFASILGKDHINIITTYQAPEQINVIYGIKSSEGKKALQALYRELFLNTDRFYSIKSDNLKLNLFYVVKSFIENDICESFNEYQFDFEDDVITFIFNDVFKSAEKDLIISSDGKNELKNLKDKLLNKNKSKLIDNIQKLTGKTVSLFDVGLDYDNFHRYGKIKLS